MDFLSLMNDDPLVPVRRMGSRDRFRLKILMTKTPAAASPKTSQPPASETEQERFGRIILRPQFKPLKAVMDNLGIAVPVVQAALLSTKGYEDFLGKLGYRVVLVNQIHANDCYARIGPNGGIRAVLPVHDMATYSTMVTLVNYDSTVTTTANSVVFYDRQLDEFRAQLKNTSGNAA